METLQGALGMFHCIQDCCGVAETKNLERSGIRQKSFVGAEQKQTFMKSHIKQLPVHFVFIVENVADKKKASVGENLQPQGS